MSAEQGERPADEAQSAVIFDAGDALIISGLTWSTQVDRSDARRMFEVLRRIARGQFRLEPGGIVDGAALNSTGVDGAQKA